MDGRAVHPRWRKKHQQPRHSRSMKICHNSSKAPKVACYDATNWTIIIYCNGLKAVPSYQSTRPWMRQTNPANRPSLAAFVSAITRYQEFLARHIEHFSEISVSMCVWMLFMKLNIARGTTDPDYWVCNWICLVDCKFVPPPDSFVIPSTAKQRRLFESSRVENRLQEENTKYYRNQCHGMTTSL